MEVLSMQLPIMSIDYFSNVLITIELRIVYSILSSVSGCYYCSNRYKSIHWPVKNTQDIGAVSYPKEENEEEYDKPLFSNNMYNA